MAQTKTIFGAATPFTVTNLHSLANSPTTGWSSANVDNSTDGWDDALVQVSLAFSNTAPANSRCAFVFAYASADGSTYPEPLTGNEGTVTLPDVTLNPMAFRLIGIVPYNTTGATVESSPMSVAAAFGGVLPPKWGVVVVNHSGAALQPSGSSAFWRGVRSEVS